MLRQVHPAVVQLHLRTCGVLLQAVPSSCVTRVLLCSKSRRRVGQSRLSRQAGSMLSQPRWAVAPGTAGVASARVGRRANRPLGPATAAARRAPRTLCRGGVGQAKAPKKTSRKTPLYRKRLPGAFRPAVGTAGLRCDGALPQPSLEKDTENKVSSKDLESRVKT